MPFSTAATAPKRSPFRNSISTRFAFAFSRARASAASLISVAVTETSSQIFASEMPMAPLPQQRSSTFCSGGELKSPNSFPRDLCRSPAACFLSSRRIFAASVTRTSVSWRGIRTSGPTLKSKPMNSCLPVMCCSGMREARFSISSKYSFSVSLSASCSLFRNRMTLSQPFMKQ